MVVCGFVCVYCECTLCVHIGYTSVVVCAMCVCLVVCSGWCVWVVYVCSDCLCLCCVFSCA